MIEKFFDKAHLLHQTSDTGRLPESPIAASIDAGDSLVLSQEGRQIIVEWASAKELCNLISMMIKARK